MIKKLKDSKNQIQDVSTVLLLQLIIAIVIEFLSLQKF